MSPDLSLSEMNAIERGIINAEMNAHPSMVSIPVRHARAMFDAASALPDALARIKELEDAGKEFMKLRAEEEANPRL